MNRSNVDLVACMLNAWLNKYLRVSDLSAVSLGPSLHFFTGSQYSNRKKIEVYLLAQAFLNAFAVSMGKPPYQEVAKIASFESISIRKSKAWHGVYFDSFS